MEELQDDYAIHLLDFSGHGKAAPSEHYSIQLFANDVLNYLDAHSLSCIDIFGYSMGGYVALYLALHHPERINRIFTLATKFNWSPEIALKETAMLDPAVIEQKLPAFAQVLDKRHSATPWKEVLHKTAEMMRRMGESNPLTLSDFEKIQHPVMITIGDSDKMVSQQETEAVKQALPLSYYLVFPETQHPIEKLDLNRLSAELKVFFR